LTWKILLYNRYYCIYTKTKLIWGMSLNYKLYYNLTLKYKFHLNLFQRYWWVKSVYIFFGHTVFVHLFDNKVF
jgi:hypothetical protein